MDTSFLAFSEHLLYTTNRMPYLQRIIVVSEILRLDYKPLSCVFFVYLIRVRKVELAGQRTIEMLIGHALISKTEYLTGISNS